MAGAACFGSTAATGLGGDRLHELQELRDRAEDRELRDWELRDRDRDGELCDRERDREWLPDRPDARAPDPPRLAAATGSRGLPGSVSVTTDRAMEAVAVPSISSMISSSATHPGLCRAGEHAGEQALCSDETPVETLSMDVVCFLGEHL